MSIMTPEGDQLLLLVFYVEISWCSIEGYLDRFIMHKNIER